MANFLFLDQAFNAIIFDINEYSFLPIMMQLVILIAQFYFYAVTGNKFADQYFFVMAFLYLSYLGIQGFFGISSNILKKTIRNIYNLVDDSEEVVTEFSKFVKIKFEYI